MQKNVRKNTWLGGAGARMCKKSSLVKRPSKTVGRLLFVSTPPHTQVKNVTMSERRKRIDAHPGFQKPTSRGTRDQNSMQS